MPQTTEHWHDITDSEIIKGAGWQKGKLVVTFQKDGRVTGVYAYTTKEADLCCKLSLADSPGQFAHRYIINRLPFAKIG